MNKKRDHEDLTLHVGCPPNKPPTIHPTHCLQLIGSILAGQKERSPGAHLGGVFIDVSSYESLLSTEAAAYGWSLYHNISRYTL